MSAQSDYNKTLIKIQQMANNSAKTIQQLVNSSNTQQMNFNKQEAKTSRDWEKMMSDTSHQREVKDLKKSGLNPVLSVNQGAQSYTTSAASTNNDSGASATAALLEGQLGAMSNLESARMSTEAQLKASKQQAAATRYAAAQSASAQRYAAAANYAASKYRSDMAYRSSKYASDKGYESTKYAKDKDVEIANIGRGKTWAGLLDKWVDNTSVGSAGRKIVKRVVGDGLKATSKLLTNPKKFYNDSWLLQHAKKGIVTPSYSGLNKSGKKLINNGLTKLGLTNNGTNRKLYFNAFVLKDQSAANTIFRNVYSVHYKHGSKTSTRTGHR